MLVRFTLLFLIVSSALSARYHYTPKECEPCRVAPPKKVTYVTKKRCVPKKVCVMEEVNCRQQKWQKVKSKQLVCKMVPKYFYQDCYKYVPYYENVPSMKQVTKTVYVEEEYCVPECTQEEPCDTCY